MKEPSRRGRLRFAEMRNPNQRDWARVLVKCGDDAKQPVQRVRRRLAPEQMRRCLLSKSGDELATGTRVYRCQRELVKKSTVKDHADSTKEKIRGVMKNGHSRRHICAGQEVCYSYRRSKVFVFEVNYLRLSDCDTALLIVNVCLNNAEFSA